MNRQNLPAWLSNRLVLTAVALILLLFLAWPTAVHAAPPRQGYEGPEKCAECHYVEAHAWAESSHANALSTAEAAMQLACAGAGTTMDCSCLECHTTAFNPDQGTYAHSGVTCEACHGIYQEDHPQNGPMVLTSDSSLCETCHVDTHEQWELSPHGEADVGCTSCHQVHSQDLRLDDQALCDSCHRDQHQGPVHLAHVDHGIDCVDCHLSAAYEPQPSEGKEAPMLAVVDRPVVASHTFAVSSTDACLSCHIEGVGLQDVVYSETMNQRASELALELDQAVEENHTLQTLSLVALGVGLGIGAFLGVVLVLAMGFVCQRRSEG